MVFAEAYPSAITDFSDILKRVKASTPDVLMAASVRLEDLLTITRQMREVDLNVKMSSSVPYGLLPDYYKQLGKEAEFVYSGSFWDTGLTYPETANSWWRTRRSTIELRTSSQPPPTPAAGSWSKLCRRPEVWTPTSSVRRSWLIRPRLFWATSRSMIAGSR